MGKETKNKDVTVILPIHEVKDNEKDLLLRAIKSFKDCQEQYSHGNLHLKIITTENAQPLVANTLDSLYVDDKFPIENLTLMVNGNDGDFFSLIMEGVKCTETDYFSILEFDDYYNDKWFNMWYDYSVVNEDTSIILPIIVKTDIDNTAWQFNNEIVWANSFSNEIGFIDFESLTSYFDYILSGAVFNREDFIKIGGFKKSMSFLYGHEFLLRLTSKKLKAFVVPKEGYVHIVNRENSMLHNLTNSITQDEYNKWLVLAQKEYVYTEDRETTIDSISDTNTVLA